MVAYAAGHYLGSKQVCSGSAIQKNSLPELFGQATSFKSHNLTYRDKKQPLGGLLGHLQMIRKSASELGKAFALGDNVSTIGNDSRKYS